MTDTTFPTRTGDLPGYLAVPDGPGPWPGVVVIHDVGGLTDDIRRHADRLATAGFLAAAPNLYRGNAIRCVVGMMRSLKTGVGPAVDDVEAVRDLIAADPRCTGRMGAVGFCIGGGMCLVLAPRGSFDATAPNYGNWPADVDSLRRACPVVASYGADDPTLKGAAARLSALLEDAGVPHDVEEYPGVGHSFMNDWRNAPLRLRIFEMLPGFRYSEAASDDAWRRITEFFGAHLSDALR